MIQSYFRIGVVAPMRIEFEQIAHLRSERLLIRRSGVGSTQAASAAQSLIDEGCELIISWGFCGALNNLNVGDIVRAGNVIDEATHQRFTSPVSWPDTVISSNQVADRSRKSELTKSGALAVDMESAAIARVCVSASVAFAVLRVVLDDKRANWPSRFELFSKASLTGKLALLSRHPLEFFAARYCIYRATACLKRLSVELEGLSRGEAISSI